MPRDDETFFTVRHEFRGSRPVITIIGEVDLSTAAQVRAEVERALDGHDRIEFDLRDTTFMDSTGLAVFVAAYRRLGQNREAVVLREPRPTILKLLEISGVGQFVDVRTDGIREHEVSGETIGAATDRRRRPDVP